jgi:aminoglycoside 3-N-acetyltransferase
MRLKKVIFSILPLDVFIRLRKHYRLILRKMYKPLSEQDFKRILTDRLGIGSGSVVFIHSSVDALNIRFDEYRLLEILIETVGKEGTLLFPAWHFTYRAEDYLRKKAVFDVKRSPSALGLLSEMARRHPESVRSIHPINSIVAIGKYAITLTEEHGNSIYPCDESSPYYRMMKYNGQIIGIGVDTNFLSFVHCPEDVMKGRFPVKTRMDELFEAEVRTLDGNTRIVKTLIAHPQVKNNDIRLFIRKHLSKSVCKDFTYKGNRFFRADSTTLFEAITNLSGQNITIYTEKAKVRNSQPVFPVYNL